MLKSLYSGVTGMKNIQTKMDVISNNIANVNTTSFKTGRVRFEDMISQTNARAQAGTNAQQVGLGVQVGSIDTVMSGGSLQSTGRPLDFAIENGDNSFFTVQSGTEKFYTRDGGFYLDNTGNLVTSSGLSIMGYTQSAPNLTVDTFDTANIAKTLSAIKITQTIPGELDANGKDSSLQDFTIDKDGYIVGTYSNEKSYIVGRVALTSFSNPDGLEKQGGNLYAESANSGKAEPGNPSDPGYGSVRSGFLEMSNVDLANEFTDMIVTSRAYQANSRSITTSDTMLEELINLKR
ncbi:flagellar hook protein FlgE [Carnobacterium iners]|uniref:Flagellar hook protein FlgE n=1 Tax=Carnobacterium iners TaxID=1073423 RepID=A0A1X7N216_9LACT|nr:flagellar hook-basal body complex protein [Carnobacterium iners]SEK21994.1 flagellar hook protein FlgE [Carnobacterium iners]SMH30794.1 flagellar hook protein FlgE [Carnobacterium iners]